MEYFSDKGIKFDFLIDLKKSKKTKKLLLDMGGQCIETDELYLYVLGFQGYFPKEGILLSGYSFHNDRVILGPCQISSAAAQELSVGDWITLNYSRDRIKVETDPYSTSPVFYSEYIVSNSLHLIHKALKANLDYSVNLSSLASNFIIQNSFTHQQSTFQTPIKNVFQLQDQYSIEIKEKKTTLINNKIEKKLASKEEYWELIDKGANEIVNNISCIKKLGRNITAALTGGRDSRLLYSAILAGGWTNDVTFTTKDIGQDLEIAASILGKFGGNFYAPTKTPTIVGESLEVSLNRCFSNNFYTYHAIEKLVKQVSYQQAEQSILLGGSFGEVYRGFYHDIVEDINNLGNGKAGQNDIQSWLHKNSIKSFAHPELVTSELENTFLQLETTDTAQAFISHYLNFRAKYHFGNKIHRDNKIDLHPLQSENLLELSRRVSSEVLFSGRIIFDVTRHLCEELAYHEYDTDNNFIFDTIDYHKPSQYDNKNYTKFSSQDFHSGIKDYEIKKKITSSLPPILKEHNTHNFFKYVSKQLPMLVENTYSRDLFQAEKDDILEKVYWLESKNSNNLYKYYSIFNQINHYTSR